MFLEHQQFYLFHIWYWRNRTDLCARNSFIDWLDSQKYNKPKEKHGFEINRYHTLRNMQRHSVGCWKHDFDKILLINCTNKWIIWIYSWTRWVTCWQPAQFRRVGSLPSNHTRIDGSGLLKTRTANLAMVQVRPRPGPEVMVWNCC